MYRHGDRINSTLYVKPTDTYNYLHYNSCHPQSNKSSIPYSQFLRFRRNCTEWIEFLIHSIKLYIHFSMRGYPIDWSTKSKFIEKVHLDDLFKWLRYVTYVWNTLIVSIETCKELATCNFFQCWRSEYCHIFMSSPFRVPVHPVQDPRLPHSGSPYAPCRIPMRPAQDPHSKPYTFNFHK